MLKRHAKAYSSFCSQTVSLSPARDSSQQVLKIKFSTKDIFWVFPILRIEGMVPFCELICATTLVHSDMILAFNNGNDLM